MSLCGMPTCWARCATGRCLAGSGTGDNGNESIGFTYGLLMADELDRAADIRQSLRS